jgi:hypothetical protein
MTEKNHSEQRVNNNSLKNLKPYPKGVSGNPGGRKKNKDNGEEFFSFLKDLGKVKPNAWSVLDYPDSYVEGVAIILWKKAMDGDLNTIKYLAEVGALNQTPKLTKKMISSRAEKNPNESMEELEKKVKSMIMG